MSEDIRSILSDIRRHIEEIRQMEGRGNCLLGDQLDLMEIRTQIERLSSNIEARNL